ncbi:MAG: bifunctional phosphopantothenoylcysteine decarboxylase/phosphopantothenate--cysteine ligase CoaBC, partial [Abditibacteriota bacterium]|nr:bifunctional phosphopantothenoylcysteine decarboxylase/phosphopantothenate--cysteine ligase CoaBC [Abditibacteriota bacterium]
EHISLAKAADLCMVAPASANIIGKIANGIADDMASTTIMAVKCPKLIAPAMNTAMYESAANRANMAVLADREVRFVEPESGRLACGEEGRGRLASPEAIADYVCGRQLRDYEGRHIAVTAGATISPIDPVRFLSNHSSGKMGAALAAAALKRGARVTVVCGRVSCEFPAGAAVLSALTNEAMYRALENLCLTDMPDALIAAAAPCDYVCETAPQKIKKDGRPLELVLTEARDIVKSVAALEKHPVLAGFAAETEDLTENALRKLKAKGLDMIVANDVSEDVFGSDYDRAVIIHKNGTMEHTDRVKKTTLAHKVLDSLAEYLG